MTDELLSTDPGRGKALRGLAALSIALEAAFEMRYKAGGQPFPSLGSDSLGVITIGSGWVRIRRKPQDRHEAGTRHEGTLEQACRHRRHNL